MANRKVTEAGLTNVRFEQGDIFHLPFGPQSFDHIFVCFVLEHLSEPDAALHKLRGCLRVGGTITLIEGDHGSAYFHPDSEAAHAAIRCQVELQSRAGGNALIGRSLYPLLVSAGYSDVRVSPRMVYVDSSKPELVDGFTKKTFTAMVGGRTSIGNRRRDHRCSHVRQGNRRPISDGRAGWHILLHLLQGGRESMSAQQVRSRSRQTLVERPIGQTPASSAAPVILRTLSAVSCQ